MIAFLLALTALAAQDAPVIPDVDRTIEVPMSFDGDAIFVDGKINGKNAAFFFDSGFSGSVMLTGNLNVGPESGTQTIRDFVHTFEVPLYKIESLSLGELNLPCEDLEIPKQALDLTSTYGKHCDAMLGMELLTAYVVELNFENKKMIFHPRNQVDITKRAPDNERTFLYRLLPSGVDTANVEIRIGEKRLVFALDTGNAGYVTTHREHIEALADFENEPPRHKYQSYIASGPVNTFDWWAHDFTVAGIPVDHGVFEVIELRSSTVDDAGTIGIKFLQKFNVTIDYRRRAVWFERIGDGAFKPPPGETGIYASFDESVGRWKVFSVQDGSPAAAAGIMKGDIIYQIDGQDVRQLARGKFYELLEGDVGTVAKIRASRRGTLKTFELTRKHLINGAPPEGMEPEEG